MNRMGVTVFACLRSYMQASIDVDEATRDTLGSIARQHDGLVTDVFDRYEDVIWSVLPRGIDQLIEMSDT